MGGKCGKTVLNGSPCCNCGYVNHIKPNVYPKTEMIAPIKEEEYSTRTEQDVEDDILVMEDHIKSTQNLLNKLNQDKNKLTQELWRIRDNQKELPLEELQ